MMKQYIDCVQNLTHSTSTYNKCDNLSKMNLIEILVRDLTYSVNSECLTLGAQKNKIRHDIIIDERYKNTKKFCIKMLFVFVIHAQRSNQFHFFLVYKFF